MSYTTELENLIVTVLLPSYEKHNKDLLDRVDPKLIQYLNRKKVIAALFKPKEKIDERI